MTFDDNLINRMQLFLNEKTYTYIKDIFGYNFNGFIIRIDEEKIIFDDDELGEIPIRKDDVAIITYSKKKKEEGKK